MPKLIRLVKHGSNKSGFLEDLLKVLVQVDPEGTECVPLLVEALNHEELEVVDTAANCLSLLGPRAKDAVPALARTVTRDFHKEFFNDYDPQVHAAKALWRIGPQAKAAIPALIGALKSRYRIMGPGRDYYAAKAAAEVLGSFGSEARAAIPALIETIRTSENESENWPLYRSAILALGQIRPDANAAVPVLRDLMTEYGEKSRYHPEVVIATYQLAPDGKTIAERWLEKTVNQRQDPAMSSEVTSRAMVLGAMGRTSFEADCLTSHYLQRIEWMPGYDDPRDENWIGVLEGWFESLGNLGSAGRMAIPRLNEFRRYHRNPWVRMWAAEALKRIAPASEGKVD